MNSGIWTDCVNLYIRVEWLAGHGWIDAQIVLNACVYILYYKLYSVLCIL